jgi:hypothetical protein
MTHFFLNLNRFRRDPLKSHIVVGGTIDDFIGSSFSVPMKCESFDKRHFLPPFQEIPSNFHKNSFQRSESLLFLSQNGPILTLSASHSKMKPSQNRFGLLHHEEFNIVCILTVRTGAKGNA